MNLLNLADGLDRAATLALNSLHVPLTDAVWMLFSDKKVWYPFYLIMVVLLFTRMNWKKALIVLVSVVLAVVACDQLANLVKASVCRLRPCWDSQGRQGAGGRTHLVSPAMAAAAAVSGHFVDVRTLPASVLPT